MPISRSPFPVELKAEAARLAKSLDRLRRRFACELEVSDFSLAHWIKQAAIDNGEADGLTTPEQEELKRLRRADGIPREDRAILRKAATLFAREEMRR